MGWLPISPPQASTISGEVDALALFMLAVSLLIALGVFVCIVAFVVKYRRRPGNDIGQPARHTAPIEIAWTIVPLALAMIPFVWGARIYLQEAQPPPDALEVYVVAKQWMWKVQYEGGQEDIDELHVPIGRPVRVTLISQDVIHDFFVPDFRVHQDVLPNRYTTIWFQATQPGEHRLFCSQYCGTNHSMMTGRVVAMTPADFANWLKTQPYLSPAGKGEQLFNQLGCNTCHRNDTYRRAPVLEGLYGRPVQLNNGQTVIADDAYVRESILNPGAKIVNGWENIMPSFSGRLTDAQVDSLVAYVHAIGGPNPAVPPPSPPNNLILTPTAGS
jgi:cytochrome c oxidase subunit 2